MRRETRVRFVLPTAAALALAAMGAARAGDPDRSSQNQRLSVVVKGRAQATADSLEVELTVSSSADDSSEAERHYREKRARVLEAWKGDGSTSAKTPKKKSKDADEEKKPSSKKKSDDDDDDDDAPKKPPAKKKKAADDDDDKAEKKDDAKKDDAKKDDAKKDDAKKDDAKAPAIAISITERALTIGPKPKDKNEDPFGRIVINGNEKKPDPQPMQVASRVVATIKGLKALEKDAVARRVASLIDSGVEAGADGNDGAPPFVRFLIDDAEALRQTAYKDALAKARARATQLAGLAERKLGRIISIHEVGTAGAADSEAVDVMTSVFGQRTEAPRSFPEFASEVELRVEFELLP